MKTSTAVAELPVEQETAKRETPKQETPKQENGQEIAVPQKETTSKAGPSPKGSRSKSQAKASAKKKDKEKKGKGQALDFALEQIQRKCGEGSIMFLGADHKVDVATISTGSLSLDVALGVGGVPRGRIVEIYGPESSGKTTLTLEIIANAQKTGGSAGFIDAEHALDPSYARKLGVNLDTLLVSQPDSGEQALEIAEMLINSNALDVIVIDSVAALVPRAELEGDMGDHHVGLQARLMSQALRKLTGAVNKSKTCLIFINQIREKIGVMFGSPETTSGGRALKFYSSVRLDIRRIGAIKDGDTFRGNRTRVKVVKNKVAAPFRQAEFDIIFNEGISYIGDLLDIGVEQEIVKRSGAWYSFEEVRIGQGRDRTVQFLDENTDILEKIETQVRAELGL
ncbi:MAG TPA: recombinase RecA [Planctomycetes bacterium]|jgi:recombination protein RecA|nr:recombinase RecA [Planctomycetota bacterium]